jgi:hypothetical protein
VESRWSKDTTWCGKPSGSAAWLGCHKIFAVKGDSSGGEQVDAGNKAELTRVAILRQVAAEGGAFGRATGDDD